MLETTHVLMMENIIALINTKLRVVQIILATAHQIATVVKSIEE